MAIKTWGRWTSGNKRSRRGGQGTVYLVKDTKNEFNGIYALKELKILNNKSIERFKKEIEAIIRLEKHPNVISIVDKSVFEDVTNPYYVMEWADKTLDSFLSKVVNDYEVIFDKFERICEGVKFIHQNGIIHRDLKPQNILLIKDEVKIADFGICLFLDNEKYRLTFTGEVVGPRFYMAPELEDGRNLDVDKRADIYSLGKILYFTLSGKKIFAREKYNSQEYNLSRIYNDDRFRLFDRIFSSSINQSVFMRYQDTEELLNELNKIRKAFLEHARTTIYIKSNNPLEELKNNNSEFLKTLNETEMNELLSLAVSAKSKIGLDVFNYLSKNLRPLLVNNFFELLKINYSELQETALHGILVKFFGNKEFYTKRPLFELEDCDFRVKFKILAIKTENVEVLNNVVRDSGLNYKGKRELAYEIVKRFELLEQDTKVMAYTGILGLNDSELNNLITKRNETDPVMSKVFEYLLKAQEGNN